MPNTKLRTHVNILASRHYSPSQQRKRSLRGMAHMIANDVSRVAKPFFDKDENPPVDILDRCFHRDTTGLRGGSLSQEEKILMASQLIPKALAKLRIAA